MSTAALTHDTKPASVARTGATSLRVNTPGDLFEQEAERAADRIASSRPTWSFSKLSMGGPLQRDAEGDTTSGVAPPVVDDVLRGAGHPLDRTTRGFMESRFGHDFSRVRVFDDDAAGTSAQAVSANAYTVGEKIVFNHGRYAPHSTSGRRLLAHELTHVVQQSRGGVTAPSGSHAAESEAHGVGDGLTHEDTPIAIRQSAKPGLARSPSDGKTTFTLFNLTLTYPPNHVDHLEAVPSQQAIVHIGEFLSQMEAHIAGGKEEISSLKKTHDDQWAVSFVSNLASWRFGSRGLPDSSVWDPPQHLIAQARTQLRQGKVLEAAAIAQDAANQTRNTEVRVYEYREGTISGAGIAKFGLQVIVAASAATIAVGTAGLAAGAGGATALAGLGTGATASGTAGLAGIAGGGVFGAAQQVAGQASEVHGGLRREIDFTGIAIDTVVGMVTGFIGGKVGGALLGRLFKGPLATLLAGRLGLANSAAVRISQGLLSDLVAGRLGSLLGDAISQVVNSKRFNKNLTMEAFLAELRDKLLDPQSIFIDALLGAATRRLTGGAPTPHASAPEPGAGSSSAPTHVNEPPPSQPAHATPPSAPAHASPPAAAQHGPELAAGERAPVTPAPQPAEPTPNLQPAAPAAPVEAVAPHAEPEPTHGEPEPAKASPAAPAAEAPQPAKAAARPRKNNASLSNKQASARLRSLLENMIKNNIPVPERLAFNRREWDRFVHDAEHNPQRALAELEGRMDRLGVHAETTAPIEGEPAASDEVRDRPNLKLENPASTLEGKTKLTPADLERLQNPHAEPGEMSGATHPEILRANWEKANGRPFPEGHDAHHIVPTKGSSSNAEIAHLVEQMHGILERDGIRGDDAVNGVPLVSPYKKNRPDLPSRTINESGTSHGEIHTLEYYKDLANALVLSPRGGAAAVLARFADILRNGRYR